MEIKKNLVILITCFAFLSSCKAAQIQPTATETSTALPTHSPVPTNTPTKVPSTKTPTPSSTPIPRVIPFTRITNTSVITQVSFLNYTSQHLNLNGVYHSNIENTITGLNSGQSASLPAMSPGAVSFLRDADNNIIFVYVTSEEVVQRIAITNETVALALKNPIQSLPELKSLWSGKDVEINFENNSSVSLDYFWVDFDGNEIFSGSLEAGQSQLQPTKHGNAWLIRDKSGNDVFFYFATDVNLQNIPVSDEAVQ